MPYEKQNFKDGQVLEAEHLNKIEDGIEANEKAIEEVDKKIPTDYAPSNHNHDGTYQPVGNYALKNEIPTSASQVGAEPSGTVSIHNTSTEAHNDIRLLVEGVTTRLNALANSDDTTLDQMAEVVAYIKNNKSLIDSITTSKVNVTDIIDNLVTNVSNKPLSAAQGVVLYNELLGHTHFDSDINVKTPFSNISPAGNMLDVVLETIDIALGNRALKTSIPTKTSQLTNDSNFLTSIPSEYVTEKELTSKGYAEKSNSETWTFTLEDGTPVTKKVVLG